MATAPQLFQRIGFEGHKLARRKNISFGWASASTGFNRSNESLAFNAMRLGGGVPSP
jgi:hypothetical protein